MVESFVVDEGHKAVRVGYFTAMGCVLTHHSDAAHVYSAYRDVYVQLLDVYVCKLCGTRWMSFPVLSIPSRSCLCGTGSY